MIGRQWIYRYGGQRTYIRDVTYTRSLGTRAVAVEGRVILDSPLGSYAIDCASHDAARAYIDQHVALCSQLAELVNGQDLR